jgi:hypothetical protein
MEYVDIWLDRCFRCVFESDFGFLFVRLDGLFEVPFAIFSLFSLTRISFRSSRIMSRGSRYG